MKIKPQEIVYIAGPYRADTIAGVVANIRAAEAVAAKYWRKGYAVICPHKNSGLMDGLCPDSVWLEGDITIMLRCDIVVMMQGYDRSKGAKDDLQAARNDDMEIIFDDGMV